MAKSPAGKKRLRPIAKVHKDAPWPERDAELRELWKIPGLSSTQVGRRMGLTKDCVLGRCRRLGLTGKAVPSGVPAKRKHRALSPEEKAKRAAARVYSRPRLIAVEPEPAPDAGTMTFAAAACSHVCMFPYGDLRAGGLVCGRALSAGDRRYCEGHRQAAMVVKAGGGGGFKLPATPSAISGRVR